MLLSGLNLRYCKDFGFVFFFYLFLFYFFCHAVTAVTHGAGGFLPFLSRYKLNVTFHLFFSSVCLNAVVILSLTSKEDCQLVVLMLPSSDSFFFYGKIFFVPSRSPLWSIRGLVIVGINILFDLLDFLCDV